MWQRSDQIVILTTLRQKAGSQTIKPDFLKDPMLRLCVKIVRFHARFNSSDMF